MTDLIARGAAGKMFSLSLPRQQGLDAAAERRALPKHMAARQCLDGFERD